MAGHARQRGNGTWELRAYVGRDPLTGRKRYTTKTVEAKGKRAVDKALVAFVAGVGGGGLRPSAAVTFGELVQRWTDTAGPGWSPSNEVTVRRIVASYLRPLLPVRIDRLRTADLDAFYAGLRQRGGQGGRPLAVSSVRRIHTVVRSALAQAVRWEWLATNPASKASPGPVSATVMHPPEAAAVAALLERAEADSPAFAVFLVLAAVTGARRGELLALRWPDVDQDSGSLTIARAICDGPDGPVERTRPKTAGSVRRIALDEATLALLAGHRARMAAQALMCGVPLPASAFLFSHQPDGSLPWRPGFASLKFRRLRDELGLDEVRLHDLRHFVATTLLAAGVDLRTVAGRLGHAGGGRTTLAVYAHFQQAPDRVAADLLGKLLARPVAPAVQPSTNTAVLPLRR
ncbi:MAG TPA: site-specific integrase [Acidimicrobiales bacterium]|nr:site-specific integrase [Acidimicrobiales bacterium]